MLNIIQENLQISIRQNFIEKYSVTRETILHGTYNQFPRRRFLLSEENERKIPFRAGSTKSTMIQHFIRANNGLRYSIRLLDSTIIQPLVLSPPRLRFIRLILRINGRHWRRRDRRITLFKWPVRIASSITGSRIVAIWSVSRSSR